MLILATGCMPYYSFDEERARKEILTLHEAQRDYHLNNQPERFVDQFSSDFISVSDGTISRPGREESLSRFQSYFNSVTFIRWDDRSPPVIRFSDDGSLAYTIVDKKVILQYENEAGKIVSDSSRFAWTSIYRKEGDHWKIESVTSTNR